MIVEIDLKKKVESNASEQETDKYIVFSKKIISALDSKAEAHNKLSATKVFLYQLKEMFVSGASEKWENATSNVAGWARVNMYLRMLGQIPTMVESAHVLAHTSKATSKKVLDFSCLLRPIDADFIEAKADIEKYKVDFEFGDIANLYLAEKGTLELYYKKLL